MFGELVHWRDKAGQRQCQHCKTSQRKYGTCCGNQKLRERCPLKPACPGPFPSDNQNELPQILQQPTRGGSPTSADVPLKLWAGSGAFGMEVAPSCHVAWAQMTSQPMRSGAEGASQLRRIAHVEGKTGSNCLLTYCMPRDFLTDNLVSRRLGRQPERGSSGERRRRRRLWGSGNGRANGSTREGQEMPARATMRPFADLAKTCFNLALCVFRSYRCVCTPSHSAESAVVSTENGGYRSASALGLTAQARQPRGKQR